MHEIHVHADVNRSFAGHDDDDTDGDDVTILMSMVTMVMMLLMMMVDAQTRGPAVVIAMEDRAFCKT